MGFSIISVTVMMDKVPHPEAKTPNQKRGGDLASSCPATLRVRIGILERTLLEGLVFSGRR